VFRQFFCEPEQAGIGGAELAYFNRPRPRTEARYSPKTFRHQSQSASVTSVRCSPIRLFLARTPRCSPKTFHHQSPSVASVTSVRCSPHSPVSRTAPPMSTKDLSPPTPIPLGGLRDLRAMLFPIRLSPHGTPDVHQITFATKPQSPSVV
jgi:hypothetical protein